MLHLQQVLPGAAGNIEHALHAEDVSLARQPVPQQPLHPPPQPAPRQSNRTSTGTAELPKCACMFNAASCAVCLRNQQQCTMLLKRCSHFGKLANILTTNIVQFICTDAPLQVQCLWQPQADRRDAVSVQMVVLMGVAGAVRMGVCCS